MSITAVLTDAASLAIGQMMMLIGETLYAGTTGVTAYSPWFESCGDSVTFAIEVMAIGTGGNIRIDVQTKTADEDDSQQVTLEAVDIGGPWTVSTVKVGTARYEGCEELLRFKYIVAATVADKDFRVHFRMLPPMWQGNCLNCTLDAELARDVDATF